MKRQDIIIFSYLLCAPLVYWKSQDVSQLLNLQIGSMVLFGLCTMFDHVRKFRADKYLSLFVVYAVSQALLSGCNVTMLTSASYIFSGFLIYYSVYCYCDDVKLVSGAIKVIVLINCGYLVFQFFNVDPAFVYVDSSPSANVVKARLVGVMSQSNHLGMLGIIGTIIAIANFDIVFLIGSLILLFLSQSYIAVFGSLVSMYVYSTSIIDVSFPGTAWRAVAIWVIAMLGFFTFAYVHKDDIREKLDIRGAIYDRTLKAAAKKPITGYGPGMWLKSSIREFPTTEPGFKLVHDKLNCQYLRFMFNHGLIGIGLLMLFLRNLKRKLRNFDYAGYYAAIIGILIVSIFQDPMHFPRIAIMVTAAYAALKIKEADSGVAT